MPPFFFPTIFLSFGNGFLVVVRHYNAVLTAIWSPWYCIDRKKIMKTKEMIDLRLKGIKRINASCVAMLLAFA